MCLMSCLLGENRDIFFPKLSESLHLITFAEIAERYLQARGLTPYLCQDEDEARELASSLPERGLWPCLFTSSDTTGEKDFEEFFTATETLDMARFQNLGIVKNSGDYDADKLAHFTNRINAMKQQKSWTKPQLVELFHEMIPGFGHKETGKYLDSKM